MATSPRWLVLVVTVPACSLGTANEGARSQGAAPAPSYAEAARVLSIDAPAAPADKPGAHPACPPNTAWGYATPGCGADAKGTCLPTPPLPCWQTFCSCEGVTIHGCGATGVPFRSGGKCP